MPHISISICEENLQQHPVPAMFHFITQTLRTVFSFKNHILKPQIFLNKDIQNLENNFPTA